MLKLTSAHLPRFQCFESDTWSSSQRVFHTHVLLFRSILLKPDFSLTFNNITLLVCLCTYGFMTFINKNVQLSHNYFCFISHHILLSQIFQQINAGSHVVIE